MSMTPLEEAKRRQGLWEQLTRRSNGKGLPPALLRELGIYGGGQGIWVNKALTINIDGAEDGVAVAVLHNGSSYDDDLTQEYLIYHYPSTARAGIRDLSETKALVACSRLSIPIFVITHNEANEGLRDLYLGWVVDHDEHGRQCLISLGEQPAAALLDAPTFSLFIKRRRVESSQKRAARSPLFAYEVGKRCGWRCAVCEVSQSALLDAAHICGVSHSGSDSPLNGFILCKNHHAAYDNGLFDIEPESGRIVITNGVANSSLLITKSELDERVMPHKDALKWRWEKSGRE